MLDFNHQVACRNCMRTTGITYRYRLNSSDQLEYQSKTEYELMLLVERWRKDDGLTCDFCGSDNVEVFDIDVDGYPLYNFSRLLEKCIYGDFCTFSLGLEKRGGKVTLDTSSSTGIGWSFVGLSFMKIIEVIDERPASHFKSHSDGGFFVNILAGPVSTPMTAEFIVQKLSYSGIGKIEILNKIAEYKGQIGML